MPCIDFVALTAAYNWEPYLTLMPVTTTKGDLAAGDTSVGFGPLYQLLLENALVSEVGHGLTEYLRQVGPMVLRSLGFGLSVHFYIILPATLCSTRCTTYPRGQMSEHAR